MGNDCRPSVNERLVGLEERIHALREAVELKFEAREKALILASTQEAQRRMVYIGLVMALVSFFSGVFGGVIVRWIMP